MRSIGATYRAGVLLVATAGFGAVLGCGGAPLDDGPIGVTSQAQLDGGMHDYLKYAIFEGEGVLAGQILVTKTAGRGFLADREYWYMNENISAGSPITITADVSQAWSTPPTGLQTLSFTTQRTPTWTEGAPAAPMFVFADALTGEQEGLDWQMQVSGSPPVWTGSIVWWNGGTGNLFGPGVQRTLSFAMPPPGTWSSFTTRPLTDDGLQLEVSKNACAGNLAQDYFRVANGGQSAVNLSDVTIKYWINDTSGVAVVPQVWNGGCLVDANGTCIHPVSGVNATATSFAACGPDPLHQASWELTISSTDSAVLNPGVSWDNVQTALNLSTFAHFSPGTETWYSSCSNGGAYAPDANFAIYIKGVLVSSSGSIPPACR